MLLRELSDICDDTGLIKLRPRLDQMVLLHNNVAEIFRGVFRKKFLTGVCMEIFVTFFCQQFHSHQRIEQPLASFARHLACLKLLSRLNAHLRYK